MVTVNIYEAKTQFSRLVAAVEQRGERFVLCRNGLPVADLVPHTPVSVKNLDPDPMLAGACFLGNPSAPLDQEDWPEDLR
jgi:antitoxin (DNA-binding transcriptional repressor) of toxin-antitoxin stability system